MSSNLFVRMLSNTIILNLPSQQRLFQDCSKYNRKVSQILLQCRQRHFQYRLAPREVLHSVHFEKKKICTPFKCICLFVSIENNGFDLAVGLIVQFRSAAWYFCNIDRAARGACTRAFLLIIIERLLTVPRFCVSSRPALASTFDIATMYPVLHGSLLTHNTSSEAGDAII